MRDEGKIEKKREEKSTRRRERNVKGREGKTKWSDILQFKEREKGGTNTTTRKTKESKWGMRKTKKRAHISH
jgi:hypothetical protein